MRRLTAKSINTGDARVDRALDDIRDSLVPGLFDGARLLRKVALTSGVTKRIPHGLGSPIKGYFIVGARTGNAALYLTDEHDGRHGDTDKFAYIKANGASATLDLVVF